jgi:hypothetical protein
MTYGTPGPIRTADLLLRRQTLYPAELRAHNPPVVSLTPNPAGFRLGRARIRAEQSITAKQTALRQISHSIFSSQNEPGAKRPAVGPLWFFGR